MRGYWRSKSYQRGGQGAGFINALQGLLWPLGIFFLIYTGWWFPGIFVLIVLSAVLDTAAKNYAMPPNDNDFEWQPEAESAKSEQPPLQVMQPISKPVAVRLPSECPGCGAPVGAQTIKLGQPQRCTYCHRPFENT